MYKFIIVEGPDNSGKDFVISLIKNLLSENKAWCSPIAEFHCTKPSYPDSITDKFKFTKNRYAEIIGSALELYYNKYISNYYNNVEYVIFNRSWIGEYVYGNIYRGFTPCEAKMMQYNIKDDLFDLMLNINEKYTSNSLFDPNNVEEYVKDNFLYIQLDAKTDWIMLNDDNKSLSNNNSELIKKEQERFNEVFGIIDYMTKVKLTTTSIKDGKLQWKDKLELENELKQILNMNS